MSFLPAAKESRWFWWMGIYSLLLWLLLCLNRFVLLGRPVEAVLLLRFALLALTISAVLHTFGWLGARLVWVMATVGIIAGFLVMFTYTYREMSGWQDLAGFLAFSVLSLGGFACGLMVEGLVRLTKWWRNS
ncbi:hypothetical protein [Paenibacillus sp. GCM10012306]|uniref:hypothetical protein n=1 Tax=Paenibacillus sp. GCM10012306 TaxID=3317342 RepID=UPI003623AC2F